MQALFVGVLAVVMHVLRLVILVLEVLTHRVGGSIFDQQIEASVDVGLGLASDGGIAQLGNHHGLTDLGVALAAVVGVADGLGLTSGLDVRGIVGRRYVFALFFSGQLSTELAQRSLQSRQDTLLDQQRRGSLAQSVFVEQLGVSQDLHRLGSPLVDLGSLRRGRLPERVPDVVDLSRP